jgi:hypothetical protein
MTDFPDRAGVIMKVNMSASVYCADAVAIMAPADDNNQRCLS